MDASIVSGGADEATKGLGILPPTVSAPGIHYTTTIDARALVVPGTFIFIAFNKTFDKRVLHLLRSGDILTLSEPRPLYLDSSVISHEEISIRDLLNDRFAEPASIHLIHGKELLDLYADENKQLATLHKEMQDMAGNLSFMPIHIGWYAYPAPPKNQTSGMPRVIKVTAHPTDEHRKWPVSLNDEWFSALH